MRRWVLLTLLFLGLAANSFAVESGSLTLTIVRDEQKTRDRVLLYLVDTPTYQEDSYCEVVVRAGGLRVVAERDPEHKHRLCLRRSKGRYARFIITSRTKVPAEQHE